MKYVLDFRHVEARALHYPHTWHTTIPGLRLEMAPHPIFGPLRGPCARLLYHSSLMSRSYSLSLFIVLLSLCLSMIPHYTIDPCASPPEWTHDPLGAQASRSRPYKAPSYNSKRGGPCPLLCSFLLSCLTLFLSWTMRLTYLQL
jgi:hypothetical protein